MGKNPNIGHHHKEEKMNLEENNLIRFTRVSKKKEGIFANFKAKGVRGGTSFTANIEVDLNAAEVDPADSLEKIIEECARIAERDIKKANMQFEGLQAI
jgi:hypothetical protein